METARKPFVLVSHLGALRSEGTDFEIKCAAISAFTKGARVFRLFVEGKEKKNLCLWLSKDDGTAHQTLSAVIKHNDRLRRLRGAPALCSQAEREAYYRTRYVTVGDFAKFFAPYQGRATFVQADAARLDDAKALVAEYRKEQ